MLESELRFPVLGDPPFRHEGYLAALAELRAAGFPPEVVTVEEETREVLVRGTPTECAVSRGIYIPSAVAEAPKETVTLYQVRAKAWGWSFVRYWYYWVCGADDPKDAVPESEAKLLNNTWRDQVMVSGYGGGTGVTRPVDMYHVDSPSGLQALVTLLKSLHGTRASR